ncbi:tRNA lysidine(34) synthetase TilS [Leucobacter denitrificans]|nr:tRNA lysidine(34) synthetase TilS [Leucobacter denitrificans]
MLTRLSVRRALQSVDRGALVLVGLSGGADSLALAAALAAEAGAAGVRAGAIVVDHGLQAGSADIAARAAAQARELGLEEVHVLRVQVDAGATQSEGPESAARAARYAAFEEIAQSTGAIAILTAHTRDDQAEQVLLALARGSGTRSLAGIPPIRQLNDSTALIRPFLAEDPEVRRATTVAACEELGLEAWSDPHNIDHTYARVRVREVLMPAIAEALGAGVPVGLARSADLAREDAEALDVWAAQVFTEIVRVVDEGEPAATIEASDVKRLAELPAAVRQRVIHRVASQVFGASLGRSHTLAIAALVTKWIGQGPIFVPGIRVTRAAGALRFERQHGSPRKAKTNKQG